MSSRLTPLQVRVLEALAALSPAGELVGGAALAGFHLAHRATRDLDLVWRPRPELGRLDADAAHLLTLAGLSVVVLQRTPTLARLGVSDGDEAIVVDLMAEPGPRLTAPGSHALGRAQVLVAQRSDVFVDKLCALLGRSELRDLVDLRALLDAGERLEGGLSLAPSRDAGFSPATLAWILSHTPYDAMARAEGWAPHDVTALLTFRDDLVRRLLDAARP
jgi:hypothetical protein